MALFFGSELRLSLLLQHLALVADAELMADSAEHSLVSKTEDLTEPRWFES